MKNILQGGDKTLLHTFKVMLKEKEFCSQNELAYELSIRGFDNVAQPKISRMLSKLGAIRAKNTLSKVVYQTSKKSVSSGKSTKQGMNLKLTFLTTLSFSIIQNEAMVLIMV